MMKALNLLLFFPFAISGCSESGFAVGALSVALISTLVVFLQPDPLLPFDSKRLKRNLSENVFGQHIATDVVLKAVTSFMTDSNPKKPLVLSFHGNTGTGKSYVATIIAENIYKKGKACEHVYTLSAVKHFPHKEYFHTYSAQIQQLIHRSVSIFPRSMFIFDEMDKMQPQLIDVIKPFLDYNAYLDGVSFSKAIFIFLSNAGGNVINEVTLDYWRRNMPREHIWMNSRELENLISENIKNDQGGFSHSSLIDHHLIDHYVPFLPLELEHVRQCVMAEMRYLRITQNLHLADKVARDMPFIPEKEKIFAVKGCKSVRQKLPLYVD